MVDPFLVLEGENIVEIDGRGFGTGSRDLDFPWINHEIIDVLPHRSPGIGQELVEIVMRSGLIPRCEAFPGKFRRYHETPVLFCGKNVGPLDRGRELSLVILG